MKKVPEIIEDHIFGDKDLSQVSAPWLVRYYQGVRHLQRRSPLKVLPGEICRLEVTTSDDLLIVEVHLWYSCDGWKTREQLDFVKGELIWDTLRWGWLRHWWIDLPQMNEGVILRYKIGARTEPQGTWIFADNQVDNFEQASHFAICYDLKPLPEWSRRARVYQVFVDRFNPGEGHNWVQQVDIMQPYGGTLRGVIEKLDHIKSLGLNAIWLTPIYSSPSHHGYDISNYMEINPRFGSLEDFDELVTQIHQRDMRLIMDFVANHCSDQLPQFLDARENQDSIYHNWFTWQHWPDQFRCFYDVRSMPEFDLGYGLPARSFMLDCAQFWLKRGADGFRLDYAHGPTQDFWVDFRRACLQVKPDSWLFGEIVQPADSTARFAGSLDGSLDFHLCRALRLTFAQKTWSLSRLAGFLVTQASYFDADFSLPSFIDNHDMNRFLIPAHGDTRLLKIALMLLYFLPQPPIVYYGTEFALSQSRSIHEEQGLGFDEARLPIDWTIDSPLKDYLRKLAEMRETFPVILQGKLKVRLCDDKRQLLVMQTGVDDSMIYLVVNRSNHNNEVELNLETEGNWKDVISGQTFPHHSGKIIVKLEALESILLAHGL